MVRIRMKRMGRRHRPFYRINAVDQRAKRDGRNIENLGWYDPIAKDEAKQVSLDVERVKHWLSVGAQPSETVRDILAKHDLADAEQIAAERQKRYGKKMEAEAEARKAAEEEARRKAEEEAKAKAEEEAKAKAEAEAAAAAEESGGGESAEGESEGGGDDEEKS